MALVAEVPEDKRASIFGLKWVPFCIPIVKSKMTQQNEAQNYPRLKMGAANGHRPKRGCV